MNIHTVMVTYNRLELTKQAVASYLDTVREPFSLVVVDNNSTDGTQAWLTEQFAKGEIDRLLLLEQNRYPGYATNHGWKLAPPDTTLLHRADNDFIFLPGWDTHVWEQFANRPLLGQLGLRTADEEMHNDNNVGGNCVIRKVLFDRGLRYDERTWPQISRKIRGYTEDSFMSPKVVQMGWEWDRVTQPCIQPISQESPDDAYYQQTWADRRIR